MITLLRLLIATGVLLGAWLLWAAPVAAQSTDLPAGGTYFIQWTQGEPDAGSMQFVLVIDGVRQAPQLPTACTALTSPGPSPMRCRLPFPALTPGSHVLVLIATKTYGNLRLEAPSRELQVTIYVDPQAPQDLTVVKG